ncbi:PilZ domain-containing protein [bacterium]|nr:PilZ domain-containing protein [bacterium]
MIDKISIIRQILESDEETDMKILSILQTAKERSEEKKLLLEERIAKRNKIVMDAGVNSGKEKIYAVADNISRTGAFIRTEKKIAKGEDLAIKLIHHDGEEFGFVAKVMRVNSHGIGVMIKTISERNEINFTKFIDKL